MVVLSLGASPPPTARIIRRHPYEVERGGREEGTSVEAGSCLARSASNSWGHSNLVYIWEDQPNNHDPPGEFAAIAGVSRRYERGSRLLCG